ncbi:fam-a protein [Plasmodium chabaudi chabaudi]|uniref:Fam-a protein n=1 Tax=Plasmodium chabaudi chabaudi TaxID=31271 RepID=A0A4V0KB43_PLACU|nr:fam-a protein [Plasmodium chabaudi chabaudi]VTZ69953.1 fam-a protein [Plasmodium chabaudi chabaudi]
MNKFYIQISLFLLSIFVYGNNEALATEPASGEDTNPKLISPYATPEEIYEQKTHIPDYDPNNNTHVFEVMDEAIQQLEYHATSKDGYKLCIENSGDGISYYKKKYDDNTDILKINLNIYASHQYDFIINRLWNHSSPSIFNKGLVLTLYAYNPNLLAICQLYKKKRNEPRKYFYAIVKKTQISEDKTIIAMTSVDVDDKNPSRKEHKNPILKKADSLRPSIEYTNYIMNKEFERIYVNLAGYLIEKKGDDLEITYIESINGYSTI